MLGFFLRCVGIFPNKIAEPMVEPLASVRSLGTNKGNKEVGDGELENDFESLLIVEVIHGVGSALALVNWS
jgi:hypothetical protein